MRPESLPLSELERHPSNARRNGSYRANDLSDLIRSLREPDLLSMPAKGLIRSQGKIRTLSSVASL